MIPDSLSAVWTAIAPAIANHLWQSTLFAAAAAILTLALQRSGTASLLFMADCVAQVSDSLLSADQP